MVNALMVPMFHTLYVVYVHGGCSDLVGYPWWGNRAVKEFYASLEEDDLESLIIHSQCIDGPMFRTLCDVYVHGECSDLVGYP